LGLLLVHANETVSAGRLIEELWEGHPPPSATTTLATYVSQLRRLLDAQVLETRPGGYRLVVARDGLDAARFQAAVADPPGADPAAVARVLGEALAWWRGAALEDFVGAAWAESERVRLEGLRLVATEELGQARLVLGDHARLVPELEALVTAHPLRERLWAQLMVALYRCGRQADALRAYGRLRGHLAEELGIDPSAELAGLEEAILLHKPELDWHPPARTAELGAVMRAGPPPIRYTNAGGINIAYRVLGDGPLDLVWVSGLSSNLEIEWEQPIYFRFMQRLAKFSRLIAFDKRGMGLSDRNVGAPTLEDRMDDVRAVMDAVGSERAALVGDSEGGMMSMLFAATYPDRTVALVLYGTTARWRRDVDYPYDNDDVLAQLYQIIDHAWGTGESLRVFAPSLLQFPQAREIFGRLERASGSPGTMRALIDTLADSDVRAALPLITAPALVLHAADDLAVPIEMGRWLAQHIPGARFVELPGEHDVVDFERFANHVEPFLAGLDHVVTADRVLATVLFTDIVGSTEQAAQLGDRRWRELLERFRDLTRQRLRLFRGQELNTRGDDFLATFDGPARAIRCAQSIAQAATTLGLQVRSGLHTGEIELMDDDIAGIVVHLGARVAALAGPSEVLVTRTVVDLVAGSGLEFSDRGKHSLKGVPGTWRLFALNG
jgi:DNA-binding SARP family transcriptional activator/pimeloyl-ACP methyl ester carboxylesterase